MPSINEVKASFTLLALALVIGSPGMYKGSLALLDLQEAHWLLKSTKIKPSVKERKIPTCYPKFSRAIIRIEEVLILVVAYIVADSPHTLNIRTSLASVPESFTFDEGLDVVDIGEFNH